MPYLAHEKIYEAEGLNPVFTREGFAYAWTHYQGYLLYTLNQLIDGMGYILMEPMVPFLD
jgi:superoxide dismutase